MDCLANRHLELTKLKGNLLQQLRVHSTPYKVISNAHAIAVITEWDEFKSYDWNKFYNKVLKPAFVFDGRNILDIKTLTKIDF